MQVWQSKDATKPLTLSGNLLVSQAEAKASPNELRIITLDTAEAGRVVSASAQPLPAGVKAATVTTRTSEFTANAAETMPPCRGNSSNARCKASRRASAKCC